MFTGILLDGICGKIIAKQYSPGLDSAGRDARWWSDIYWKNSNFQKTQISTWKLYLQKSSTKATKNISVLKE